MQNMGIAALLFSVDSCCASVSEMLFRCIVQVLYIFVNRNVIACSVIILPTFIKIILLLPSLPSSFSFTLGEKKKYPLCDCSLCSGYVGVTKLL